MLRPRLSLTALSIAGLLSACSSGSVTSDGPISTTTAHIMPTHKQRNASSSFSSGGGGSGGPQLVYNGGPVLSNVKVVALFWSSGVADQTKLQSFYSDLTSSAYFDWLSEYDTSSQSIGRGSLIATLVDPSPPSSSSLTDQDVQNEIGRLIDAGTVPPNDGNTMYMVHFPPGVSISMQSMQSCVDFCGYHSTFAKGSGDAFYAVLPDVGGSCSGGCGGSDHFGNTTSVASHELIEAVTDCAVGVNNIAWYDQTNGEIGDICNAQQATIDGYTVQLEWSNKNNSCIATDPSATPGGGSGGGTGGGTPSGCGTGLTSCGGACVDLPSDNNNCGACGNACGSGATCSSGTCTTPTSGGGSAASCSGLYDGAYCGNDSIGGDANTLYTCSGGSVVSATPCSAGCTIAPPAYNDYCN